MVMQNAQQLTDTRALHPLKKRAATAGSTRSRTSSVTGFRSYRSARQMREAVSAVMQANRWVKQGTP